MIAVFRHELESHFTGLTGWVFGAFLLLFGGIYMFVYNLNYGVSNFEYVLGGMSFVFLVIVPVLTMRTLAEERHQKTDQLLYSLPLSMTEVVLGKYLAMLAVFAVPVGIVCIYPLVLSAFGTMNFAAAYSAIAGFFCLGAALISIGTYVSSVTESQAVAAGLCFVVMLVNYFISALADFLSTTAASSYFALFVCIIIGAWIVRSMTQNTTAALLVLFAAEAVLMVCYVLWGSAFEGLFPNIVTKLSLFERFYVFLDGMFDLTGIVYFITVCGVFIYLSVQSMEKRRWSE